MEPVAAAARISRAVLQPEESTAGDSPVVNRCEGPICNKCSGSNHFSRECQRQHDTGSMNQKAQRKLYCYCCNELSHVSRNCSEN